MPRMISRLSPVQMVRSLKLAIAFPISVQQEHVWIRGGS